MSLVEAKEYEDNRRRGILRRLSRPGSPDRASSGIALQRPWSANLLLQILGRLPRLGQLRHVEWVIYNVPGTMYDRMQTIVWSKYVRQLAVESRISDTTVSGTLADIAGYGLLQMFFNMPYNRWMWDRRAYDLDFGRAHRRQGRQS